jgi:hypothetical protein
MERCLFFLALVTTLACGSDDDEPAVDASRRDGGSDAGGRTRDGGHDAGSASDAARTDSGSDAGPCESDDACAEGLSCVAGSCVDIARYDCCAGGECPTALICTETCRCRPPVGCCSDPSECDFGVTFCTDDCACATCDPPCASDEVCAHGGVCQPRCFLDGCPETEVCTEAGCVPAACSADSCLHMDPPLACDRATGCFDPCDDTITAECAAMGGTCALGFCIDTSCAPSAVPCGYRLDCCGNAWCQSADDPPPPCPEPCFPPEPAPEARFCMCASGGGCVDLADGGGL